jgi:hypothetical protein
MNIFLKVLKIQTVVFERVLMVFTTLSCLIVKKIQNKVSACFYETTYQTKRENFQQPSSGSLFRLYDSRL